MRPIYSRRVRRLPYYKNTYKGGSVIMTRSKLPTYRWVQSALAAQKRRRTKRKRK